MSEIQTNSYENSGPSTNPNFDPYRIEDLDFYLRNHCDTCAAGGSCDRTAEGHRINFENGPTENEPTEPDTDPLSPPSEYENSESENLEEITAGMEANTNLDFDLQIVGKLARRGDGRLDIQHNYNGQLLFLGDASESKAEQEEFSSLILELRTRSSVTSEPVPGHIFTYSINAEGEVTISYKNEAEPEPQNEDSDDGNEVDTEVKTKPVKPEVKIEAEAGETVKDKAQTIKTVANKTTTPAKIKERVPEPSSLQILNKDSAQNTGISLDLKPSSIYLKILEVFGKKEIFGEKAEHTDPKIEVTAEIESSSPIANTITNKSRSKTPNLSNSHDIITNSFNDPIIENNLVQISNLTAEIPAEIPSEILPIEHQETYDNSFDQRSPKNLESRDQQSNNSRFIEDIHETSKTEDLEDIFQAETTTDRQELIHPDAYHDTNLATYIEQISEIQEEIIEEEPAEDEILERLTEQVKTIQTEVIKEARQVLEIQNQTPTKIISPTKAPVTRTETVGRQETLQKNEQVLEEALMETKAVFNRISSIDITALPETTLAHFKKIQAEIQQTQQILEILKSIRPAANETGPKITRTIPGRPTGMTAAQDPAETPQEIEAQLLKLAA